MFSLPKSIIGILQKSGTARYLFILIIFLTTTGITTLFRHTEMRTPVVKSIEPAIGMPGDILLIQGKHFGNKEFDSYVEISGNIPTVSSYLQWTDTVIMLKLPDLTQSGLVYVYCGKRKSNPKVFVNQTTIPVAAPKEDATKTPYITSIDAKKCMVGDLLTLNGRNFGTAREDSSVMFPWIGALTRQSQEQSVGQVISASESDFDYEVWSDQEIKVRIPTGAATGNIYVATKRSRSNEIYLEIESHITSPESRKYAVTIETDISGITASGENVIYIRIPRPLTTPYQTAFDTGTAAIPPLIENYQDKILYRIDNAESNRIYTFSRSFIIDSYAVNTQINERSVSTYKNVTSPLYLDATTETELLPVKQPYIATLLTTINSTAKNPYTRAKQIFTYIAKNFSIKDTGKDTDIKKTVSNNQGSGYDITLLYTTLLRAAGIPARPCAGFFVGNQRQARPHWWTEIYFEKNGWIPADIYIAMDTTFDLITTPDDRIGFYFGNIDMQHVVFSRGEIIQKPMALNSKTVSHPASYAFQNIWEESAGNITMYNSLWHEISITGIY